MTTESRTYINDRVPDNVHIELEGLDNCNAYVRYYVSDNGRTEYIELVSYSTPVMFIDMHLGRVWALPACTCSQSTRAHVRRFLDQHPVYIGRGKQLTYHDVKSLLDVIHRRVGTCLGVVFDTEDWTLFGCVSLPYIDDTTYLEPRKAYNNGFFDVNTSIPFALDARASRKQVNNA